MRQKLRKGGNSKDATDPGSGGTHPHIKTMPPESHGSRGLGSAGTRTREKTQEGCSKAAKASKTMVWRQGLTRTVGAEWTKKGDEKLCKPQNKKCICEHCGQQLSSKSRYNVHVRRHTGSKPFQCSYADCKKSFHDNLLYKRHLCRHRNERSYFCGQCGKGYFYKNNLQEHMQVHTKIRPFSCNHCGKTFTAERIRNNHVSTHTLDKPYHCHQCPSAFSAGFILNAHMRSQHTNQTVCSCPTCGKAFRHRCNLNRHIRWHKKDRPHQCQQCDKAYYFPSELAVHMRSHAQKKAGLGGAGEESSVKTDSCGGRNDKSSSEKESQAEGKGGERKKKHKPSVKKHPCSQCSYSFPGPAALRNHVQAVHEGKKPFSCHLCGKSYTMVGSLNVHMLRHEGKRSFKCDSCEKLFFRKTDLTKHGFLHQPKQFICKDCGASFRHKQALDVHVRIHSGVRPYSCPQCDLAFTDNSTLKGHLITHTDTKDHVCSVCGKAYKYSKTLKQHMKAHTSAITRPFSRLLHKSKVDVVVTNSDARVVGISHASKSSNIVKVHRNLPGRNLTKIASRDVKDTDPSKLLVKVAETTSGSPIQNSSFLSTTGMASLLGADLTSSIVSAGVLDPSKSVKQVFSANVDQQNSIHLSSSQVCSVNLVSAESPLPSKSQEVLSIKISSQKKRNSFPVNSQNVSNINIEPQNDSHQSNTQVLNVSVGLQNKPLPSDSQQVLRVIPDLQNNPLPDLSNTHQTLPITHDSQSKSPPHPTAHTSLMNVLSLSGQGHVAADHSPSNRAPELITIDLGELNQNPRSSLSELSAAATQVLGQSLETDTRIIIIEETASGQ